MTCKKNPKNIEKLFNEISSYYDDMNNIISFGTHYIIKTLSIKKLQLKPNKYLLDVCCGTGDNTKIISHLSPKTKVIGIDFSPNMVQLAIKKNPHKPFIIADCTNLPFSANEFDYTTMSFGLRNIDNRKQAIYEIYRTLKPSGKFLHLDFGKKNFISKIFDFLVPKIAKISEKNTEHYQYLINSKKEFPTPENLVKEFKQAGFKNIKIYYCLFKTISFQIMEK